MHREYDIFEILPDGASIWRGAVRGLEQARAAVSDLARQSTNQFLAVHTPTKEIVSRTNMSPAPRLSSGGTLAAAERRDTDE